jgi:Fic family protein
VQEVSNYLAAMQHGLERLRQPFPLSLRLLREIHAILLRSGRGQEKQPGEFRRQQNWVGGTRPGNALYVPPPAPEMLDALDAFEKFLHGDAQRLPVLIQAALLHAQFETIHPFLDGNGRLGRLLITLLLVERGVMREPLLYLSLYLKQHRDAYFNHLQRIRLEGTWEEWVVFFLEAVASTAERAVQLAHDLLALVERDRARVQSLGPRAGAVLRVFDQLPRRPYATATLLRPLASVSFPTASSALQSLQQMGIVREVTGRRKGKIYVYREYVRLMDQGVDAGT